MTTMQITPTENNVALRRGDFQSLAEALDYAATGVTGMNFYSGKGELVASLPYTVLRTAARSLARKLLGLGLPSGRAHGAGRRYRCRLRAYFSLPASMLLWFLCHCQRRSIWGGGRPSLRICVNSLFPAGPKQPWGLTPFSPFYLRLLQARMWHM